MLEKRSQLPQEGSINTDYFIFCLESVNDVEVYQDSQTEVRLKKLAMEYGVASIYKTCDDIESLEVSLETLVNNDHNFINYEIIYLVTTGDANTICLNGYHYTLNEIAEIFEGKLNDKIMHFSNAKILDLEEEEAQYFLNITGAKAISGYGNSFNGLISTNLDLIFFNLFKNDFNIFDVVEELHQRHYKECKLLDFRLYY